MKKILIGSVALIAVVAVIFVAVAMGGFQGILQVNDENTYTGKLVAAINIFPMEGEPSTEMTFEDGTVFTAPYEIATNANMQIGNTYRITFDPSNSTWATSIQDLGS